MAVRRLAIVLCTVALLGVPAPAHAACEDAGGVCLDDESAQWTADATLSVKQQAKEDKKNRKRAKIPVTVTVEGGRGSAFIDGRYVVPGQSVSLAPGKHELHVRDGEQVLAQGVLTVPRKSDGFTVTVAHR